MLDTHSFAVGLFVGLFFGSIVGIIATVTALLKLAKNDNLGPPSV